MSYEATIRLETHVQLKTSTKLFCGCANEFGGNRITDRTRSFWIFPSRSKPVCEGRD